MFKNTCVYTTQGDYKCGGANGNGDEKIEHFSPSMASMSSDTMFGSQVLKAAIVKKPQPVNNKKF